MIHDMFSSGDFGFFVKTGSTNVLTKSPRESKGWIINHKDHFYKQLHISLVRNLHYFYILPLFTYSAVHHSALEI